MGLTPVREQIRMANTAVEELEGMGCAVLSVYASSNEVRPRVHVTNAMPFVAWLDRNGHTSALDPRPKTRWREGSAVFRECEVFFWLTPSEHAGDPVQTSAPHIPQ